MKIKKGDTVQIITGKDKGKTGKVLQAFPAESRVAVEGLNLMVKNVRSRQQGAGGQQVQFPRLINVSNVMLVCPKCSKPTRVGYRLPDAKSSEDGLVAKKARRCMRCQQVIE